MFVVRNVRGPAPGAGTTTVRSRVAVTRTRAPDAVGMTLAIEMSENLSSPDSKTYCSCAAVGRAAVLLQSAR